MCIALCLFSLINSLIETELSKLNLMQSSIKNYGALILLFCSCLTQKFLTFSFKQV